MLRFFYVKYTKMLSFFLVAEALAMSGPDYVRLSCCSSVCYCGEFPWQLILKLTSDVQDWIALWTSESKTVILVYARSP